MAHYGRRRMPRHRTADGRTAGGPPTIFNVVGDPTRRRIMELLSQRERSLGELVIELQLPHRTVSRHMRRLCDGMVVTVEERGRRETYALRSEPVSELRAWLTGLTNR